MQDAAALSLPVRDDHHIAAAAIDNLRDERYSVLRTLT
jgi:hypothetical protein